MTALLPNPLENMSLEQFAHALRSGALRSEEVTARYLERIKKLDPSLHAFEFVDAEGAIASARAMDSLLAAGTDLGPLMGLPIAIKDVFTIRGFPAPKAGSNVDISSMRSDTEGPFVQALRKAGCVLLGKTKTVEFCLGITGVSESRGTPHNPWDLQQHRIPGGSSSGSAVAVASGMCALAIGSDSGGSVRVPAAFNGIFGLKTSFGLWPTEGVVALDPRVDTIGLLTRTAADAQTAFHTISAQLFGYRYNANTTLPCLDRLRLGQPDHHFFDGLSNDVAKSYDNAATKLKHAGCRIDAIQIPEASERQHYFPLTMPASLIAALGADFFEANKQHIDPVIRTRMETGLHSKAADFLALETKRQASIQRVKERFHGFDAWISPVTTVAAPLLSEFDQPQQALTLALGMTQNTQPSNYLEQCAVSIPLKDRSGTLPVGLQLMASAGNDAEILAISCAIEQLLGQADHPDLRAIA